MRGLNGFSPDGTICDSGKYFWAQDESLTAASLFANRTGDVEYWNWYAWLWAYRWKHFVDRRHEAWLRTLTADNRETDYPTMRACYEVLGWSKNERRLTALGRIAHWRDQ